MKRRAPSRCTARPSACAVPTTASSSSSGQHLPARAVVRVLQREHRRHLVGRLRARMRDLVQLVRRDPPADSLERLDHEPGVRGRAAVLVDDDVRMPLGDEHVARARVQLQRDLVGHRRGWEEQGGSRARGALPRAPATRSRSGPRASARRRRPRRRWRRACPRSGVWRCRNGGRSQPGRYRERVDLVRLEEELVSRGEPAFRAGQVWGWTARGAAGYEAMTNVPRSLREALAERRPVLHARPGHRGAARVTAP